MEENFVLLVQTDSGKICKGLGKKKELMKLSESYNPGDLEIYPSQINKTGLNFWAGLALGSIVTGSIAYLWKRVRKQFWSKKK